MDIFELYSMLCKKITQSAGGVTGVSLGADGNSIDFTLASGSVDNVKIPQQLTQAQKDIVAKFSVNANGKLLFDGKEITPNFLDTTGAGNKFLADDGTYKTVSTGTTSYTKTEIDTKLANKADKTDLANKADKTDLTNKANQTAVDAINADLGSETLKTTATTVKGGINELRDNALDTISFSSDYKNIILNRKGGQNPIIIPLVSIIAHCKLVEFGDVDPTGIGNGKTLIYDGATGKHKYVASTGTDELVKMDASSNAKYLGNLIDKQTIVNDNGILKVKKLDGQEATIAEINHLKGLTMDVMDLVKTFSNGGVKVLNTPLNTYADLVAMDKTAFVDGIKYIVYILNDETHNNEKTTYLVDKTTINYFGYVGSHRDFTSDPIHLVNEVTGKLKADNIDLNTLWDLLVVNDTYQTDTVKDEPFGTHGAKAMYDELIAKTNGKANQTDFNTHINDPNIHTSVSEKASYAKKSVVGDDSKIDDTVINKILTLKAEIDKKFGTTDIVDNLTSADNNKPLSANQGKILKDKVDLKANDSDVVKKTDITTTLNKLSTDDKIVGAKTIYNKSKNKVFEASNGTDIIAYADSIVRETVTDTVRIKDGVNSPYGADNTSNDFYYTIYNIFDDNFKRIIAYDIRQNDMYMILKAANVWGTWQRICTTKVADMSPDEIKSFADTDVSGIINYRVKNGICFVKLWRIKSTKIGKGKFLLNNSSLPIPSCFDTGNALFEVNGDGTTRAFAFVNTNGALIAHFYKANSEAYGSFSYPVSE